MSKTVKLRKGLDIKLVGQAERVKETLPMPKTVSIKPTDFHGVIPKMVVKEGVSIEAGGVLFHDKYKPEVKFVSPLSGTVKAIVRGAKRKILEVVVDVDAEQKAPSQKDVSDLSKAKEILLESGLWPLIKERPIDRVANPEVNPKAIFVSGFDTSPLAPDYDFVLHGKDTDFQKGLEVLATLTSGKVHLTLNGKVNADAALTGAKGVQINKISGKHPAGNVGTQIHHIDPMNKGEFVWTVGAQSVAMIGRFFNTGVFNASKIIAFAGSEVNSPKYFETISGANITELIGQGLKTDNVRVISGNVLTGDKVEKDGHLGFYHDQVTVIPEGDHLKFAPTDGWMVPLGFKKFTNSRLFASRLTPNKEFRLDTNTNGEERAFVVTGELERVFPFDILPMQLVKAAITDDIDGMENLGIYEVVPEDFALCEFVCTSKIDIQDKIRTGLDLIADECM